uniref:Tetratricopeptide repeat protein 12 isoform X1 n=2 Tax=Pogona vitticeps TaxID=103695 RepID=A0A6J0TKF5_9SAUR
MSNQQEEQDLQRFLQDVDEVTNLIQGLSSTDPAVQEKAITETEKRLSAIKLQDEKEQKCRMDRTVINTQPSPGLQNQEEMINPESFMAAMEKDAEERARRRKENEALANELREKGNDAFSKGDYEEAIRRYTEGLNQQKDAQVLYTNRAQAYIKLQKYEKALSDCDWALRCDEKCIKALFHMGKAYLAQRQYSKARECYLKILEINPQKDKLCRDCIKEIDLKEKRQHEEEKAMEEFESGKPTALSVAKLLQKLSRPDENILYYAGGIRLLTDTIQDGTEQVIFRTNNGFSIINDNEVIRRAFQSKAKLPAEVELSLSILLLWQAVCRGNEENQRLLLTHPDVNVQLPALLLSEMPAVQEQCMALLTLYAETEAGRGLVLRHLDTTKWLQILMSFVKVFDGRATCAMNLLTSLIAEEKFKIQCRIKLSTGVLPLFSELLTSVRRVNEPALAQCIAVLGDLCSDMVIRLQMVESQECWQACLSLVDECWKENKVTRYPESLYAVLGLMMNLSLEHSLIMQEHAEEMAGKCMSLFSSKDGRIVTRAVQLLSLILPTNLSALEEAMKQGVVKKMIQFLKAGEETTSACALKILACCVKSSRQAQEQMVKFDKKCHTLLKLLRSPKEAVAGNAAFCLGKCLEVPGTATDLLDTDIVRILLKVTGGEAHQAPSVQENAAIALGKLCTADARHTSRLRELNGMAVLSKAMKYVQ